MTTTIFTLVIFLKTGFGGHLMVDFRTAKECEQAGPVVAQALANSLAMPAHWICSERTVKWGDA